MNTSADLQSCSIIAEIKVRTVFPLYGIYNSQRSAHKLSTRVVPHNQAPTNCPQIPRELWVTAREENGMAYTEGRCINLEAWNDNAKTSRI